MLARSHQLQGIFGLLKPFIHVHILICFVEVYQNHGVQQSKDLHAEDRTKGDRWDSVVEQTFSLQKKVHVKGSESWAELDP